MRRNPLLAMVAVLALLFTACGDDDDTNTATEDVDDPTEVVSEEETDDVEDDDDAEDIDVEDALGGDLGECGFLAGFATAFEDFDPTAMTGAAGATDFGQLFGPLAEASQEVADAAPEEIKDAFRTMADAMTAVADELEGVVIDFTNPEGMDPEAMAKLESLGTAFEGEYSSAAEEIDTWITSNCADLADRFDLDAFGS